MKWTYIPLLKCSEAYWWEVLLKCIHIALQQSLTWWFKPFATVASCSQDNTWLEPKIQNSSPRAHSEIQCLFSIVLQLSVQELYVLIVHSGKFASYSHKNKELITHFSSCFSSLLETQGKNYVKAKEKKKRIKLPCPVTAQHCIAHLLLKRHKIKW